MRTIPSLVRVILTLLLVLPGLALAESGATGSNAAEAKDAGKALIKAAQDQDLETVKSLLKAGVVVNSATRYGATALSFAAEKGNLPIVELLLEKGAEINVTDTFYNSSPLLWSLFSYEKSDAYPKISKLLLKKGADQADAAISFGLRMGALDLVQAAVATGKVEQSILRNSQQEASTQGKTEIADYLASQITEEAPEAEVLELNKEQMAPYEGNYRSDQLGMNIKVWVAAESLKAQADGQPAFTLGATGENTFTAMEVGGIEITFGGRGGLIENFVLAQSGQTFQFARIPEAGEEVAEEEPSSLPPIPEATRTAAAPWPSFRGPAASGIGDGQGMPTSWDGEKGENVRWRTPIPGIALSSPVIWGDKVFVSTAASEKADSTFRTGLYGDVDSVEDDSTHSFRLYALDRTSGEILWQKESSQAVPKVKRHLKSSHANPTPVTDGKKVVVHFPSEGLHCYDIDGKLLWTQDLGVLGSGWFYDPSYEWGFASSPILHEGTVIVQADIYEGSFLAAFDLESGKELWRTSRDEIPTWSTPNILPAPGPDGVDEVVTNGTTVRGYDASTGAELWTLAPNSEVVVGTPIVGGGLAYVTGGYPPARPIYAIKPGGKGDLSLPEGESAGGSVQWSVSRGGTYIPTPILYRGILYMLHNNGRMSAHEAATGEELYRQRVGAGASFSGSPVAADGRLYMTSEEGITFVIRAGRDFELLGENPLGEVVMTTPAISDGLLVIRGMDHIYGLGLPETEAGTAATATE